MKPYILFLFVLFSIGAGAQQTVSTQYLHTANTKVIARGFLQVDSSFTPKRDTTRPFYNSSPDFCIRTDGTAWVWSVAAQKWVSSGSEKHLANTDLSLTANRKLSGRDSFDLTLDSLTVFRAKVGKHKVEITPAGVQLWAESPDGTHYANLWATASNEAWGHAGLDADGTSLTINQGEISLVGDLPAANTTTDQPLLTNPSGKLRAGTAGSGGITDGDKGDITVSSSGAAWTVDKPTLSTLTDSAVVLWNYLTQGIEAKVTLAGNRALSITNLPSGKVVYLTLGVTQDATGSRTLSLPAGTKVINGGSGAVTLTTTGSATDILSFRWNGTTLFCTIGKNYN